MGLFGKSFEEKVNEAIAEIGAKVPGVKNVSAQVDGKIVTLSGTAISRDVRSRFVQAFIAQVEPENTVTRIVVDTPQTAQPDAAAAAGGGEEQVSTERIHAVVPGDTLSGIAKKYYGKAGLYMKIFEANKDQLDNPDLIKVGQKLRIPL
jgi:nucleoid-associated protein YgaU